MLNIKETKIWKWAFKPENAKKNTLKTLIKKPIVIAQNAPSVMPSDNNSWYLKHKQIKEGNVTVIWANCHNKLQHNVRTTDLYISKPCFLKK